MKSELENTDPLEKALQSLSPEQQELLILRLNEMTRSPEQDANGPGDTNEKKESRFPIAKTATDSSATRETVSPPSPRPERMSALSPLSYSQKSLWFTKETSPGSAVYNIPNALHLKGRVDRALLKKSIELIINRHEILRSTFIFLKDEPYQRIHSVLPPALAVVDLQEMEAVRQGEALQEIFEEESLRPFDLGRASPLRACLVLLAPEESVLIFTMHHIVCDGSSIAVFTRELREIYSAFKENRRPELPEIRLQYADFAAWQQERFSDRMEINVFSYWRRQLSGMPYVYLPADRPRHAASAARGDTHFGFIGPEILSSLRALAREEKASVYMVTLAAFKSLLTRYRGNGDIAVAAALSGRKFPELEEMIGFVSNPTILRTDLPGALSFREAIRRVRRTVLDAFEYQDLPYIKLQESLKTETEFTGMPQVFFQSQTYPFEAHGMNGVRVQPIFFRKPTTRLDLEFYLYEDRDCLRSELIFNREIFNSETLRRFSEHFIALLRSGLADPDASIKDLSFMAPSEMHLLLKTHCGDNKSVSLPEKSLPALFSETALTHAERTAIADGNRTLTYRETHLRSNQMAHFLRAQGLRSGEFVGLRLQRSADFIISLLAVMKAGGVPVPLSPDDPPLRIRELIEEINARMVIAPGEDVGFFRKQCGFFGPLIEPSILEEASEFLPENDLEIHSGPDDPACVYFTSGSSGPPRPVGITHRNIARLSFARFGSSDFKAGFEDVFLFHSSTSFDASSFEIWCALLSGAKIVVFPRESSLMDTDELARIIESRHVSILWLTSALFHLMTETHLEILRRVPQLLVGGEAVSAKCARRLLEKGQTRLYNCYGPTENGVFSSVYEARRPADIDDLVSIGRPLEGTQIYILDENQKLMPAGIPGEICTAGDGLALGYLGRTDLTAERFPANPFSSTPEARMYRTGDLGRLLPDGNLQFLGRMDNQAKIRGYRVEPGEIEACLRNHEKVGEAAVLISPETNHAVKQEILSPDDKKIIAFVEPEKRQKSEITGDAEELGETLKKFLKERLPAYLQPSQIVILRRFPRTASGKTDRTALIAERISVKPERDFSAPRGPMEEGLAEIWKDILGLNRINAEENFFSLGGNSLQAIRMRNELRRRMNRELPLDELFQGASLRKIARNFRRGPGTNVIGPLIRLQGPGSRIPFFCIPPITGNPESYLGLARRLGPDQGFYALRARGLGNAEFPFFRVEDMARFYAEAMRNAHPGGPYFLGGWSFGGLAAFETARILESEGHEVGMLVLMDALPPPAGGRPRFTNPIEMVGELVGMIVALTQLPLRSFEDLQEAAGLLGVRLPPLDAFAKLELEHLLEFGRDFSEVMPRILQVCFASLLASMSYAPREQFSGPAVLLRAARGVPAILNSKSETLVRGWREAIPEIHIQDMDADHMSLLGEDLDSLAGALRDWLSRTGRRYSAGNKNRKD